VNSATARLQVLAAAVLFSTGGAGIKVQAFDAAQVSALRSGIAAVTLLAWLHFSTRADGGRRRRHLPWSRAALGAGVIYAATLTLFVTSTKLTTAANAIFLQSTAPLYVLVLAPLVLRERFRWRDVCYLAAAAAGLVFCFLGQADATATAPNPPLGNLVGAASGLVWALTLLSLRHVERDAAHAGTAVTAVVIGNVIASAGALPLALPLPVASLAEWLTIVYLGVFQIGLAYVCLTAAVRHLPALDVSLLLLLELVLNPVWTWLIRGEQPGRFALVGGAFIFGATALKSVLDARAQDEVTHPARR
jgi:drug/metabolite transporter, DME family